MLWKTHVSITNEVLYKLGTPKSSVEAAQLRKGLVAPDKWEDYPHHYGRSSARINHNSILGRKAARDFKAQQSSVKVRVFQMDVFEAVRKRRSIRKFRPKPVPDEKLEMILEAGRLAPSAGNRQPWRFVVVKDPERKRALAEAAGYQMFIADAGVILVALGDPEASPRWFRQDPMIAVEHMVLTATALGYGTCWIGAFGEEEVKSVLKIPDGLKVIALLPIGFPDESPPPRERKPLKEIASREEYGKPF